MGLADVVEATLVQNHVAPGSLLVLAVSGGCDSVVMLHLLVDLAPRLDLALHVATFDHRWRPESAEETEWVRALADSYALPCTVGRAEQPDRSEAGARRQRREFLLQVAEEVGAAWVATAHTADDRAETLLLNLLRGAGATGLGALGAIDPPFVRPLIDIDRAAVRGYAAELGLRWCEDPSNADLRYERNRLRAMLAEWAAFRPGAPANLRRSARVCGEERAALQRYAQQLLDSLRRPPRPEDFLDGLDALVIDAAGWAAMPLGERWLVLRRALAARRGRSGLHDIDLARIESFDRLAAGRASAGPQRIDGPEGAIWILRAGARLVLCADATFRPWGPLPIAPGRTPVPPAGLSIVLGEEAGGLALQARLRAGLGPLEVRSRRAGDRLRPAGRGGSRSVKKLLIELGVPRVVRDRVPVLVCGEHVVWLPGCRPDERYEAPAGQGVVVGVKFDTVLAPNVL